MTINPLMQLPGMELSNAMPGQVAVEGAPKGLFAALFGEQQALVLAQATGTPVLLSPDGTLSTAIDLEALPEGALLVLPDGTQWPVPVGLTPAPEQIPEALSGDTAAQPAVSDALAAAVPAPVLTADAKAPSIAPPAEETASATSGASALQGMVFPAGMRARASHVVMPNPAAPDAGKAEAVPSSNPLAAAAQGTNGLLPDAAAATATTTPASREGGAGAFAAALFAPQTATLESTLARDPLRAFVPAALDEGAMPSAQAFARTDVVRPIGEMATVTAAQSGEVSESARSESALTRAGLAAERPTLEGLSAFSVRAVRVLAGDGERSLTVRLVPEHLGELKLTVRTVGETVQVHVASASAAVRDVFEGQSQGLRDALGREGIDLSRVTVSADSAGQQASARQSGGEGFRPGALGAASTGPATTAQPGPGELSSPYRHAPRIPDTRLDLFA